MNKEQEKKIESYILQLIKYNSHTNIVGKSTLNNPWKNHILDSIQIVNFINNKNLSIVDMGTGAGLPGAILSVAGFKNVFLLDSNRKKIKFLEIIKKNLNFNFKIIIGRAELIHDHSFDIITCRALANLNKLFSYSQNFLKKNTLLIFLKGKAVNEEIEEAKKNWHFIYDKHQSYSDPRGSILCIKELKRLSA